MNERAEKIFKDAQLLHDEAIKELGAGKIRDAAEKAWGTTLRAVDALILARTGEEPVSTSITTRRLHKLALEDAGVDEKIVERYHTRMNFLHGDCFYLGICEPIEDVKRRIRGTKAFIEDAKILANRGHDC